MARICSTALALTTMLALTACGAAVPAPVEHPSADDSVPPTPPAAATPTMASTQTERSALEATTDLSLAGVEGLTLQATFTPGTTPNGSAVLLLHMYGSDRSSWRGLAEAMAQAGVASLAIDLRGHGQTGGAEDWNLAPHDVEAAFDWLRTQPGIDPSRVGIAGASIGANLALVQSAEDADVVGAAALLSPGLDTFRVKIDGLAAQAAGVPLYLVAAEADGYSAQTVRSLAGESPSDSTLVVFDGSAHGTDMFSSNPELSGMLVDFFFENLSG